MPASVLFRLSMYNLPFKGVAPFFTLEEEMNNITQEEFTEKQKELNETYSKYGKICNEKNKIEKLLKANNANIKLSKYAVISLSLLSIIIFSSLFSTFSVPFLLLDLIAIISDTYAIAKLKYFYEDQKKLQQQQKELKISSDEYLEKYINLKNLLKNNNSLSNNNHSSSITEANANISISNTTNAEITS